ncbi:MAG: DUF839 domain-containing protein, partial [Rubrivivax sp.]|nr:DUF839 domain-containing protein [Rubrivivax sp.]
MAKDFDAMEDSNRSSNPSIHEVSDPARRIVLGGGLAVALTGLLSGCASSGASAGSKLGFKSITPDSSPNGLRVPPGYVASVIAAWGEPVGVPGQMPAWQPDASNNAGEQALQMGMHHDGIHYYALDGARRGLLAMNHEYVDDGLLHPDGRATWHAGKVAKAQAAHGIAVIEVEAKGNAW